MARLALATIAAVLTGAAPALAANAAVTASGTTFTPADVTISTGEKVTWTNGGGAHNVRFEDGQFEVPADPSGSWPADVSRTFSSPGSYAYYCEAHGSPGGVGMSGTVTVTGISYTWDGGAGSSSWEDAANWSPDGIPGTSPTDMATVNAAFVNMGGDHTIAGLTLQGGAHRGGNGTLTLTGASTWTNGSTGPGRTVVAATGQLTWNGGTLTQGEVENLGSLTVGGIQLGAAAAGANPAVLDNQGTAVMTATVTDGNVGQAVVRNPGQLSGVGTIGPPLSNSGTVTAQGGLLVLTGSVVPNPGDYAAAGGATLRFAGSTTGEAGAKVSGAGTVEVAAGVSLPSDDATGWVVPGVTRITGGLSFGGGSTGSLDVDGAFAPALPFVATGGTNTWTGNLATFGSVVTVQGTTTLQSVKIWNSAKLRLEGPSTLVAVTLGNADAAVAGTPELRIAGPTTVAGDMTITDTTTGGSPSMSVLAGGTLALGTRQLTVEAPFGSAGTLGVQLDSASVFGRLTATGPVTLGGALAVSGAFVPGDPLRVISAPAEPAGSFSSVTSGFETVKDATGVLLKTAPVVDPTPSPTASPTATAAPAPTATATPVPTVQPPAAAPRFASLVKLPRCATRRTLRVQLRAPAASARVLIGRKLIRTIRGTRAVTLRKLPKRAFTLKFEVKLKDGRVVKGSRKFPVCKKR